MTDETKIFLVLRARPDKWSKSKEAATKEAAQRYYGMEGMVVVATMTDEFCAFEGPTGQIHFATLPPDGMLPTDAKN